MQQNMKKLDQEEAGWVLWGVMDMPDGCDLFSSSALVVTVALSTFRAHKQSEQKLLSRMELAELCRRAEHYVVTMGGGRDQAVVCLAHRGVTLHLDFSSVSVKSYPVNVLGASAAGLTFVVANSLKQALRTTTGEI
ncbi:unnamed protein product [Peronospora farinosa]|uniref:GHMP kinase N-terminal domain-containing protein n=1 Tax=Peronospora farinosa TaxID=134698 RepID=A0ABN8CJX6_9STRA|nr:unnamed protein product [Peronospora farinosa]